MVEIINTKTQTWQHRNMLLAISDKLCSRNIRSINGIFSILFRMEQSLAEVQFELHESYMGTTWSLRL